MNYQKFYRMLDVLPPADYVNPSIRVGRLPQPYRMVLKILEEDVLDLAWEEISIRNMPNSGRTSQDSVLASQMQPTSSVPSLGKDQSAGSFDQPKRTMNQGDVALQQQIKTLQLMKSLPRSMRDCKNASQFPITSVTCTATSSDGRITCLGTAEGRVLLVTEALHESSATAHPFDREITAIACDSFGSAGALIVALHKPSHDETKEGDDPCPETESVQGQLIIYNPVLSNSLQTIGAPFTFVADVESVWVNAAKWVTDQSFTCACVLRASLEEETNIEGKGSMNKVEGEKQDRPSVGAPCRNLAIYTVRHTESSSLGLKGRSLQDLNEEEDSNQEENMRFSDSVSWTESRDTVELPRKHGEVCGLFCKSRLFFTTYIHGDNEVQEHDCMSSASKTIFMPSGVLCHAQRVSTMGVEFCAFGLVDGCIMVWNVWAGVARATLRHHLSSTTSVHFLESDEENNGLSGASQSTQILAGCSDGKLRLFQLSSDAPSSAAIRPRKDSSSGFSFSDKNFAASLTGGNFLAEFEACVPKRKSSTALDSEDIAVTKLYAVSGTPLLIACTRYQVQLYDIEAGAQVGSLIAENRIDEVDNVIDEEERGNASTKVQESKDQSFRWRANPVVALANQSIFILDHLEQAFSYPGYLYITTCYPCIARAVKFIDSNQRLTAAARFRLGQDCIRFLNSTTAEQRCNPDFQIVGPNTTHAASTTGLASLMTHSLTFSDNVSPRGNEPEAADQSMKISFSRVGFLASKMQARRVQASKNVINPTRLSESLVHSLPGDKLTQFEERRTNTRADRERHLADKLQHWMSISSVLK